MMVYLRSARLCVHQLVTIPYIVEANGIIPSDALRHPMVSESGDEIDVLQTSVRHKRSTRRFLLSVSFKILRRG
jgi:hypothetical protein